MNSCRFLLAWLAITTLSASVQADFIKSFAYTDRGVYSGSFTRHTTLGDAQAGASPVSSGLLGPKDLSLFFVHDVVSGIGPLYDSLVNNGIGGNTAQLYNQWFYNAVTPPGVPNLNNDPAMFLQMDDFDGSTPVSHRGFWTSPSLDQYRLQVSGQNATATPGSPTGEPDRSRLAVAGNTPAANPSGFGTWVSYDLDLTFDGLFGSPSGLFGPNFFVSKGEPSAISGTFTGIFQMNNEPTAPFFRVTTGVTLGQTYGFVNRNDLDPNEPYLESTFGGPILLVTAVPAPPGVFLAGFGAIVGLLAVRRRRQPA